MKAIVFGNVTLDTICYPINEVPRYESINFDDVNISAGGCGSNTAIGLAALGIPTGIVACIGDDDAADLIFRYWHKAGVDHRFVQRIGGKTTGIAIGLIDNDFQPRFVHTPGANGSISADLIAPSTYAAIGTKYFHIAGFFVLPNLFNRVEEKLEELRQAGITTSLDVAFNVRMENPKLRDELWSALPHLDYFTANAHEAYRLTGEDDFKKAAEVLRERGAQNVIIKLGAKGVYALSPAFSGIIPGTKVKVVDTTGAGDAFAAGFIASLVRGGDIHQACIMGNQAGARICTRLGAIEAWFDNK